MENIKERVDDSFKCSKRRWLENKSQKINFNYSVARVGYIFACYDVDGRSETSHLTC
jgi:hypothetical protein